MTQERIDISINERGGAEVKRSIEDIGKSSSATSGLVKNLRGTLMKLAGAAAALQAVRSTVGVWREFGYTMSTVQAVSEATGDQFDRMRAKARELGATTKFSASEAGEGMLFLARAGFTAEQNIAAIGSTLKLAQAGALDLGTAADIASNVLMGFRGDVEQLGGVIDVLARAANTSNTNVQQLGQAMKFAAPVASGLGVSVEETAAAIGTLSDAGIQASMAGTSLRNIMARLEAPTSAARKVLQRYGIDAEQVKVSQVGLTEAMKVLVEAGVDTGAAMELFGARAGPAFEVLSNAIPELEQFHDRLRGAEGTTERIADVMGQNLHSALLLVRSALQDIQIGLGDLGPEATLTKVVKGLASALQEVAANLEVTIKLLFAAGLAFAALKFQAVLAALTIKAVKWIEVGKAVSLATAAQWKYNASIIAAGKPMAVLLPLLTKLRVAVMALWKAMALNPLSAGLVALGAGVAALTIYFDKMNKMQREIESVEERIHQYRLKRLQDQVREIQQRNANTKALEDYMDRLERENTLLAMTNKEREETITLDRAIEIAKRPLTELEEKRVIALLEEKQAIKERNEILRQEEDLLNKIKGPAQEYAHNLMLLDNLRAKGRVTEDEYKKTLEELQSRYGQLSSTAFPQYLEQLREETRLMQLSNHERQVAAAIAAAEGQVGGKLEPDQRAEVEAALAERRKVTQDAYLEQLKREGELIGMNNTEREIAVAIDRSRAQYGEDVDHEQAVATAIRANEQRRIQAGLLDEILGPTEQINRQIEALNHMMADPALAEYHDLFLAKQEELIAMLGDKTIPTFNMLHEAGQEAFRSLNKALDDFVDTGTFKFRDMISDMIRELIRLAQRQMLMKAMLSIGLPGFQHGGSFTVGGAGGPDSQLVAFAASPGERVDISTPGQRDQQADTGGMVVPPAQVRVVNVMDPNDISELMESAQGEQIIMNAISRNRRSVRQAIS